LKKKAQISKWYMDQLSRLDIKFQEGHELGSQWVFPIIVPGRDDLMMRLADHSIESRIMFYPIDLQPPYWQVKYCPVSNYISTSGMYLPSGTKLSYAEVMKVCKVIKECV
jgi:dTDP-4-amino-4,6-dideoxygalactose transaminase